MLTLCARCSPLPRRKFFNKTRPHLALLSPSLSLSLSLTIASLFRVDDDSRPGASAFSFLMHHPLCGGLLAVRTCQPKRQQQGPRRPTHRQHPNRSGRGRTWLRSTWALPKVPHWLPRRPSEQLKRGYLRTSLRRYLMQGSRRLVLQAPPTTPCAQTPA